MPSLIAAYDWGRRDPSLAVLEGVHVWKHAVRFGAEPRDLVTNDPAALTDLITRLAPDLDIPDVMVVDDDTWRRLAPHPPTSPLLAIAPRPSVDMDLVLASATDAPVVALEHPSHLGNVGAVVRVAAAADAAAVLVIGGTSDPWHPAALRGGAGLQFAVPTQRINSLPTTVRPLVAVDPTGDTTAAVPRGAVLVFGTERHGLRPATLAAADLTIALPMRAGVSSLNLATTVSAVLYRRPPG